MEPDKRILALQSVSGFSDMVAARMRYHKTVTDSFWEVNELYRKYFNQYRYSSIHSFMVCRKRWHEKAKTTIKP